MIAAVAIPAIRVGTETALIDQEDAWLFAEFDWHIQYTRGQKYVWRRFREGGKLRKVYLHRIIMDTPPDFETDHINRNGLDNRRANLRVCTPSQNQANSRKVGPSGVRGVYRKRGKWVASIRVRGRRIQVGTFETIIDAGAAYARAAKEYFGEFAKA